MTKLLIKAFRKHFVTCKNIKLCFYHKCFRNMLFYHSIVYYTAFYNPFNVNLKIYKIKKALLQSVKFRAIEGLKPKQIK